MTGWFEQTGASVYTFDGGGISPRNRLYSTATTWTLRGDVQLPYTVSTDPTSIIAVLNSANSFLKIGAVKTSGNAGAESLSGLTLGSSFTPAFFGKHNFKSFVISQYGLTETQCNAITTYLNE